MSRREGQREARVQWDPRRPGGLPHRRLFLQAALALPCLGAVESDARFTIEARFYDKLPYKKIKCKLCPRECVIDDRERGYCGVRENRGGTYYSLVYSRVCAAHVDPIEKKPLFHFLPGTMAFSVATAGCPSGKGLGTGVGTALSASTVASTMRSRGARRPRPTMPDARRPVSGSTMR